MSIDPSAVKTATTAIENRSSAEAVRAKKLVKDCHLVFWDFDGVIKDSVTVKADGFEQLFLPYGRDVAERVRKHHEANGGVSRYEKIPIYLEWVGETVTPNRVQAFCDRFSELVCQAVIDAAWVPGVHKYLRAHHASQPFVLVTATPQEEILQILHVLGIADYFREVHGTPTSKTTAIQDVLRRWRCPPSQVLVVGDSDTDLKAAEANGVAFLLRRTAFNQFLQERYSGPVFDDLNHE